MSFGMTRDTGSRRWTSFARRFFGALSLMGSLALASQAHAGQVRFDGEGHAQNPVWSLDGKWVAFEVNRFSGNIEMYVSQVAGSVAKDALKVPLPGGGSGFGGNQVVVNPQWHPQGIMVFEGSNQGGQFRIYFAQPGGASAAEMLTTQQAPGDLTFPVLSPEGNLLGYVSDQTGSGDIRTWDRSSGSFSQLTRTSGTEVFPLFSSDGSTMAFTRKSNNTEDLYVMGVDGSGEQRVMGGNGDQSRPAFAEGGQRLAYFTSERGEGQWDLASVTVSGSGKQVLARDVRLPERARPAVTPDGQWVAFAYQDPAQADKVVLMRSDGSRTVEIDTDFKACGEPALTVQNGRVLLAFTALPEEGSDWRFLSVMDITDQL